MTTKLMNRTDNPGDKLPYEILIEIAKSDLNAALIMVLNQIIGIRDFKKLCNNHIRQDTSECLTFLRRVADIEHEKIWDYMAQIHECTFVRTGWKVLDQSKCWNHQGWESMALYQLAIRGIFPFATGRNAMRLASCRENPQSSSALKLFCNETFCLKGTVKRQELYNDAFFLG